MARNRRNIKQLAARNRLIAVMILLLIGFLIYMMIQISHKIYEEKMKDYRVTVDSTYKEALTAQLKAKAVTSDGVKWKRADKNIIDRYMNPLPLYHHSEQQYQFLNLTMAQHISAEELDTLLAGKGILAHKGQYFHDAAKESQINEIYLISHAMLETGKGTSELAQGVALNQNGQFDKNGRKYYNFFGIAAYDDNPVISAARYAQEQGWDTEEKAIKGGAKFIRDQYLSNDDQTTLYSMRFNPVSPGRHQYATDVRWAYHNAHQMAVYYKKLHLKGTFFTRYYYKDNEYHKNKK